jgi:hypothetical protein
MIIKVRVTDNDKAVGGFLAGGEKVLAIRGECVSVLPIGSSWSPGVLTLNAGDTDGLHVIGCYVYCYLDPMRYLVLHRLAVRDHVQGLIEVLNGDSI